MSKSKKTEPATVGHNSEREQFEEQQFLNAYRQIKEHDSDMAGIKGEMSGVYDRIKNLGFTKADVKWAKELEDKDAGDIIATMQRRIRIARMFGHGLARQFDMFDEDRTPIEERAYEEGLAAGKLRKDATNPYGADSKAGQEWQRGLNDGHAFANKDLSHVLNEVDPEFPDEEPAAVAAE
ncbi:hypothetical protein [Filomicrobium sp.]|uniref:hypothetical protein n=1 Tax=Filomicrobium sp. TaxID=2024831 RepID=UPI00258B8DEA|nr:hypothetical protein [Filomicrobium sp.]MCV0371643.1 hypothetical protein [Filomicrobium sp.]